MTYAVNDTAPGGHAPVARVVPDAGRRVLVMAAREAGVSVDELLAPNRRYDRLRPRWAAMLAMHRAGMTVPAVARRVARDRATVFHGLRRAEYRARRNTEFAALVDRMVAAIVSPAAPVNES